MLRMVLLERGEGDDEEGLLFTLYSLCMFEFVIMKTCVSVDNMCICSILELK